MLPKRATQLSTAQPVSLNERYAAGATVYERATEFHVHRHTVAIRLILGRGTTCQSGARSGAARPSPQAFASVTIRSGAASVTYVLISSRA